jgi:RecA/RadA recombinase
MSLIDKLKKSSKLSGTTEIDNSAYFIDKVTPTSVPMLNVALSGRLDGGLTPGLTVLAGPSKHFKTSFALMLAGSYLKANPDAVLMFYDSEFGTPQAYFKAFGIDTERVLHIPIMNVEELKFDLVHQLENLDKDDDVIIVVDSIGNLASKKEIEDALSEKSVADMTRAKALKGLFRMVTPYLQTRGISMLAVNHTYKEMSLYPRDVVSGGTGTMYSANTVWIIGRKQEKVSGEVRGYHFIINVEKSRFVKEKSQIPITVSWNGGISKWSGLLQIALDLGWVKKIKQNRYQVFIDDKPVGEVVTQNKTNTAEFWKPVLTNPEFNDMIKSKYAIGGIAMTEDENEL